MAGTTATLRLSHFKHLSAVWHKRIVHIAVVSVKLTTDHMMKSCILKVKVLHTLSNMVKELAGIFLDIVVQGRV